MVGNDLHAHYAKMSLFGIAKVAGMAAGKVVTAILKLSKLCAQRSVGKSLKAN